MTDVWVVAHDDYDAGVVGVCSTAENAQIIADAVNRIEQRASVTKYALDQGVEAIRQGYTQFRVVMLRDGHVARCSRDVFLFSVTEHFAINRYDGAEEDGHFVDMIVATVWARDERHAIERVNAHREHWVATSHWEASQ